jgi:hypothetical protein
VLRAQQQLIPARELAQSAAIGCRALLGERHPYYLAAAMNLVTYRFEAGEVEGLPAEMAVLERTAADVLGWAHPDALAFSASLAAMWSSGDSRPSSAAGGGDYPAGSALDELVDRLGDQHPSVRSLRRGEFLYRVIDLQDPF